MWQAHNKVNDRLAADALADTAESKFAEFAKIQWPARTDCTDCRELTMPPRAGVKQELRWRHDEVLRVLMESYCLEPRFECWEQLQKLSGKHLTGPTRVAAELGHWSSIAIAAGFVLLIVIAFACASVSSSGVCDSNDAPRKHGKKKADHVV